MRMYIFIQRLIYNHEDSFFGQVPCPSKKGNLEKKIYCGFTTHSPNPAKPLPTLCARRAEASAAGSPACNVGLWAWEGARGGWSSSEEHIDIYVYIYKHIYI